MFGVCLSVGLSVGFFTEPFSSFRNPVAVSTHTRYPRSNPAYFIYAATV